MIDSYVPLIILVTVGFLFGLSNIVLSQVLGPRKNKTNVKLEPYECGIEPMTSARERFSIKFYMTAMLFILFDIEIVFMYPWAIQFKELGITGFIAMNLFMVLLFAGFIYVVKKGALKWH